VASLLVVEDEAVVAMDIQARLIKAGYKVCGTAATGEHAIRIARERKPDLILMDISIKGDIDGIQTAERLRAFMDVPIVYVTAYADQEILRRAKITEPFGYVVKPFEDRELQVAIEIGLHRHQLTKQLIQVNERLEREILDRRRAEDALRLSEERYELATRGANDGIWDWDLVTNRFYSSPRWRAMLGHDDDFGTDPREWLDRIFADDRERVQIELSAHLDGSRPQFECEYRIQHRDGSYRWMLCRGLAIRNDDGQPRRMAGSQTDITDRKRMEEQLLRDAFRDALTGLPNRAVFADRLSQALERARRRSNYYYAVLFLDFDHFKLVNDRMGHTVGDQLLVAAASRLKDSLRGTDTLARFGGDEFVVLIEDLQQSDDATAVADRILQSLRTPFQFDEQTVYASVSIGIVKGNGNYIRPDDVLRDADIAMYRAKALGRGRQVMFEPGMRADTLARLQLESDLSAALDRGEFRLEYQPVVSLKTGAVTGFEALLRWKHPRLGLLPPAEFIRAAEESGLIVRIGEYALHEACRQTKAWHDSYPSDSPLSISVNLSAGQLASAELPEQVRRALESTGLPPGCLRLEVNETTLTGDPVVARGALEKLKALGVEIDVDDFGMGYPSLSCLRDLPIDSIKIDRYFIKKLDMDFGNPDIVRTLVALAHELSLNVIGEGVESQEQVSRLQSLQCEFGQGFYLCQPLSSRQADDLLARGRCALAPLGSRVTPTDAVASAQPVAEHEAGEG
jgi:diguanylate cyclase (GGDEF)-like protein/PAS domain S-box-containing protein